MGRYLDVSGNQRIAKFLILKTIPISVDLSSSEKKLWVEHSRGLRTFERKQREFDKGRTKFQDLKFPKKSLIDLKIELADRILRACEFCERRCRIDRTSGKKGFCNLTSKTHLSSEFVHMGEEGCIIPSHTFFFMGCNFYCIYCQNWTISRQKEIGTLVTGEDLARLAKYRREKENTRNVNLVGGDPTPNLHTILRMLNSLGTNVPIVWNSNMYMSSEIMDLLEGCVDVYLADFKYGNDECAKKLSKVPNYWKVMTRNYLLAKEQSEILIRHLVLPNHLECCTKRIFEWVGKNLNNEVRLNIMGQYHPEFEAREMIELCRRTTSKEMERAFELAREYGLTNLEP
jgi:putative pyruvate formate lyase activating enzyme